MAMDAADIERLIKEGLPDAQVTIAIGHQKYGHLAVLPEAVRQALAQDFY